MGFCDDVSYVVDRHIIQNPKKLIRLLSRLIIKDITPTELSKRARKLFMSKPMLDDINDLKNSIRSNYYYICLSVATIKVLQGADLYITCLEEKVNTIDVSTVIDSLKKKHISALKGKNIEIHKPFTEEEWLGAMKRMKDYASFFANKRLIFLTNYGRSTESLHATLVADGVGAIRIYERFKPHDAVVGFALKSVSNAAKRQIEHHTAKKRNRMENNDGNFIINTSSLDAVLTDDGFTLMDIMKGTDSVDSASIELAENIARECPGNVARIMLILLGFECKFFTEWTELVYKKKPEDLKSNQRLTALLNYFEVDRANFFETSANFLEYKEYFN